VFFSAAVNTFCKQTVLVLLTSWTVTGKGNGPTGGVGKFGPRALKVICPLFRHAELGRDLNGKTMLAAVPGPA
jgi:hypothetical protein